MRAVDLLVDDLLPDDMKGEPIPLNKKGLNALLSKIAVAHPDRFASIANTLATAGRKHAYLDGATLTLQDMKPPIDMEAVKAKMDSEIAAIDALEMSDEEREQAKMEVWQRTAMEVEEQSLQAGLQQGNNLASAVFSGARGSPFQFKAMTSTPGLYTDYKDRAIPMFVRHSFGMGLRPAEYAASTFGARRGVISTKKATAESGDLLKQMMQTTAPLIVTEDDCGTSNGIVLPTSDPAALRNRFLAKGVGKLEAGTPLDRNTLSDLRKSKADNVQVFSPLTCESRDGVCAKCLGLLPNGQRAPLGYSAGITASQAIGEPMTQGALNAKHSGGGFKGAKRTFAGMDVINQLMQSPETFPNRAAVAEEDGKVEEILDAPQGGKFIVINGKQHYALPDFDIMVQPGDTVEAGDQLSDGIVDPSDIVRLRGLGDGRRYYVTRLQQALRESGAGDPHPVQLELLARASLDHVQVEEDRGDLLAGDTGSYNRVAAGYKNKKASDLPLERARGLYLHRPVLHYTVGTQVKPSMLRTLKAQGIDTVNVSEEEPNFKPDMVRLRGVRFGTDDWLAKMHGSGLKTNIQADAARSRDTNIAENTHFAPRLMQGQGFGKDIEQTGKF